MKENGTRTRRWARLARPGAYTMALAALGLAAAIAGLVLMAASGPATAAETLQQKLGLARGQVIKTQGQFPLIVPAAEFASVGGDTGQYAYARTGGFVYAYDDTKDDKVKGVCSRAPVYLPDGAQVNGFQAHVYDVDDTADINRIELRRAPYRSAGGTELVAATPGTSTGSDDGADIQVLSAPSVSAAEVDNTLYSYLALVCMDGTEGGSTLRLYALVVDYGYDTYLPLVMK